MTKSRLKDAFVLFLITVVAGVALGTVYSITKVPIEKVAYQTQQNAYREVMSDAASFKELGSFNEKEAKACLTKAGLAENNDIDDCVQALDSKGDLLGYVITVTDHNGYAGDITFSMGMLTDGTVTGYSITSINETAGLGMKAKDEAFKSQFENKKVDYFEVTKTGATSDDEIDAISGATITSRAVTYGVDAGIAYGKYLLNLTKGEVEQ